MLIADDRGKTKIEPISDQHDAACKMKKGVVLFMAIMMQVPNTKINLIVISGAKMNFFACFWEEE